MLLRQLLCVSLFCLLVVSPVRAEQAGDERSLIHEMRSLASSICTNVLIFYNQSGSPFVERNRQSYQQSLLRLQSLSDRLGRPEVAEHVRALSASIDSTSELPQSGAALRATSPGFTRWLLPVVEWHAQLQSDLDVLYEAAESNAEGKAKTDLRALSQSLNELKVGYQIAAFSRLGAEQWVMSEEAVIEHDENIVALFESLIADNPDKLQVLERSYRYYSFTRALLLDQTGNWAPNAVERFVVLAVADLDHLAAEL
ncbi:MAG TPA: hypothetical protein ENI17_17605 [Pseudomonas xinjiangensis]|uniref:Type IV pili methyl-accepting chemotaxis transducer N-term n=2 Tax=root TaxID=1 RepID=A0A7V1FRY2_9GAMM|nr:hypothetical protein [Halopseudomonas xinjiangensis]HEC49422.1 hypothetical protein [Halopseudomonas xinjiangensis]